MRTHRLARQVTCVSLMTENPFEGLLNTRSVFALGVGGLLGSNLVVHAQVQERGNDSHWAMKKLV